MSVDVDGGVMSALDGSVPGHLDDLVEVMRTCNEVTARLQRSHDTLQSEVVRLKEALARTNAQLERSKRLAALGQMAAGIAHEVRNPLAAIQLYAGMIVDDLVPDGGGDRDLGTARSNATKIASAVQGLDGIVSDVLRFTRDLRPRRAVLVLRRVVDRAVENQRPVLEAAGVRVDVGDVPEALCVDADAEMLHQALINLLRNAAEALAERTDEDVTTGHVVLSAARCEQDVRLKIADDGPGIPSDRIEHIFDPFYTSRSTGTGLGLTIVHRIIDAHGGAISAVTGAAGGGAVFEICLPVGRVEP